MRVVSDKTRSSLKIIGIQLIEIGLAINWRKAQNLRFARTCHLHFS